MYLRNSEFKVKKYTTLFLSEIFRTNDTSLVVDGYPEHGQLLIRVFQFYQ